MMAIGQTEASQKRLNSLASSIWFVLLVAVPFVIALVLACGFIPYQRDDAYITYRFAANFASWQEIVFNQGGPWVEGFSSPIWFLLLAMAAKIKGSAQLPTVSMVLGMASFLALLLIVMIISKNGKNRAFKQGDWQTFLTVSLLATLPAACYYATTGLETLLFALVVLCYAGAIARLLPISLGVAAGFCAAWVRPEGPWLMVMGFAQLLVLLNKGDKISGLLRRQNMALLLAPLAGLFFLTLVRWYCFESLLPNTYWAKEPELTAGLLYVLKQFSTPWYGLLLLAALLGGFLGGRIYLGFLTAGLAWVVAVVLEGGDWMPLGRMLLCANVLFTLAAGGLFHHLVNNASRRRISLHWKFLSVSLLLLLLGSNLYAVARENRYASTSIHTLVQDGRNVVKWLQKEKIQSVGLVDIGEIGFLSGINVFDFVGLTDPFIAHSGGGHLDKTFDLDYLFERRRPQVLIVRMLEPFEHGVLTSSDIEIRIMQDARFVQQYFLAEKILPGYLRNPYYGLLLYKRKNL
jgi:hypothetical protein